MTERIDLKALKEEMAAGGRWVAVSADNMQAFVAVVEAARVQFEAYGAYRGLIAALQPFTEST